MRRSITTQRGGFTLVELVFSIALLGFMLTITLVTFIGVFRFYTWSNTTRQTQASARTLLETLTREIRFKEVVGTYDIPIVTGSVGYQNAICLNRNDSKTSLLIMQFGPFDSVVQFNYKSPGCPGGFGNLTGNPEIESTTKLATAEQLRVGRLSFEQVYGAAGTKTFGNTPTGRKIDPSVVIDLRTATGNSATRQANGTFTCQPVDNFCNSVRFVTAVNARQP